ncbi:MAG: DUF499 domain-containing protein [bacterium]
MALPAWWQVATPHKDIREKSFSEAVFAADLGDVLREKAPVEYQDPRLFFDKTYLTEGLKGLLANARERFASGRGDAVIQLQTPFGGGKTHALLALYHLFHAPKEVQHLPQIRELAREFSDLDGVKVAAFVGTSADVVKGRTPWGEIAMQLGAYELVCEHDERRVAPGKERLQEMLAKSRPVLILIDELLEYIVKANRIEEQRKITKGQTLAFLQELSETVGASERSMLVLTLPASLLEQYDEEAERALKQLQDVYGRVETICVPVQGNEIHEVIRTRLFENLGDESVRRRVAEETWQLYQDLGSDVPAEVRELSYRRKIEQAYPFHPELIDCLYERWGSFSTFQRTRGVLRLLARVVGDLYTRKVSAPLLQSAMVPLVTVRQEFVKHIGPEYDSIISADIAGKAAQVDRNMGSEYEKYAIAQGLATATFLYSFSGSTRKGTTLPWLRVALLREGIPPTIVGDAIHHLEDSLWYFHEDNNLYSFKNQPNLNRVVVEQEEAVRAEEIREALHDLLGDLCRSSFWDVRLWPQGSADLPDSKKLKLAVLSPEHCYGDGATAVSARDLLENAGGSFRACRNTSFLLAAERDALLALEKSLRRSLATKMLLGNSGLGLTTEAKEELGVRLKPVERNLPYQVLAAYRKVAWLTGDGVAWRDMGQPPAGQKMTLGEWALDYLRTHERILAGMTAKLILERAFGKEETEKPLEAVLDVFLKTPGLPVIENERVLLEAACLGTQNGLLGLRVGQTLYFKERVPEITLEALVVRPERAEAEKAAEKTESSAEGEKPGLSPGYQPVTLPPIGIHERVGTEGSDGSPAPSAEGKIHQLSLRATIPWDKVSQVVSGVILPLKSAGATPKITLEIHAHSDGGFDRTTLESKVKETLHQIGSRIERWEEE